MSSYADFLAAKQRAAGSHGRPCTPADVHTTLRPDQRDIVAWAVRKGRAAIWADTGWGKTFAQIEWARLSGSRALIVAPLAVCQQTIREAAKLGIDARYKRQQDHHDDRITVTNYEMAQRFEPGDFDAVVLDEASILKQHDGKTRTMLIQHFASVPHRLACTATPAPNDPEELTNQAAFLGVMPRTEMLATYFVNDPKTKGWRVKGHARQPMYRWMASWAVALRRPSDLGYPDDGFNLPPLNIVPEVVGSELPAPDGELFAIGLGGVGGRAQIRRLTLTARVIRAVELVRDCGPQGVQPGLLPSQQAEIPTYAGAAGTRQQPAAEALRRRRSVPRVNQETDQGLSAAPASATTSGGIRTDVRAGRTNARPRLPDLPCDAGRRPDSTAAHRPQSPDGHGSWCSLSRLQLSSGTSERGSHPGNGAVPLPHVCRDQWVIWCGLNDEQDALVDALGDECGSIDGRTPLEERVRLDTAWRCGEFRILVVKPGMYSFGMNWQHCARMAFVGIGDSFETYYQSIRRCWRYGQTRAVNAHIVVSDVEQQIVANVLRKEREASRVTAGLVAAMRDVWSEAA